MSGIEAVGLVLGVLPLVVEGLEKYSTAVSTTEKFLHCGRELRNLRRRLNAENEIFRNTCELLLRNITNETDTSILIADPTGEPWKNSELEERLKKALGSSYKTCCETMKDMHYTIDDLRKHLHLRPAEGQELAAGLRSFQKIKFSLNRAKYEEGVQRIRDNNSSFRQLTEQSMLLEPIRSKKRRKSLNFQAMRAEARRLFLILDENLQCECRPWHNLCLCLESAVYGDEPSGKSTRNGDHKSQRFVLAFDNGHDAKVADFEIVVAKQRSVDRHNTCGAQIRKLCKILPGNFENSREPCLGFLVESQTNRRHMVFSCRSTQPIDPLSMGIVDWYSLPLDETNSRLRFRGSVRRRLALTVASSVLQLYKTPWLQEQWDRGDIAFVRHTDGSLMASPLISKRLLVQTSNTASRRAHFSDPISLLRVRNECIFALGIFLIELCLGRPITELKEPQDEIPGGMLQFLVEFRTATRLVNVVYDEAGKRYGDVVRRCIYCDFDQREYDLDNNEFCQAVYEGVVAPLEEDVKLIDGPGSLKSSPFDHALMSVT